MAKVSVKFNTKALLGKQHQAFELANKNDLKEAIVGEIISPVWDWGGETKRRNGAVIGSPRDIVDEGTLLDGYQEPRMQSKTVCVHEFTAPHTIIVHNGAQLKNGGVIEKREFTKRPRENFREMFIRRYRELP